MLHALGCCECSDDGGYEACHLAERTLYLTNQLYERQHGTVCYGTGIQTVDTPDEGEQVASREPHVDGEVAETGKQGLVLYLVLQSALSLRQAVNHAIGLFQGLQYHAVLDALLQDALYAAVCVAYLTCQYPHLLDVYLAEQQEERCHNEDYKCQPWVEVEKVEEGEDQAHADTEGGRQGVGDDGGYFVGVAYQPVHHVARVELLLALPHAVHESCKGPKLHQVLALNTQQGAAPLAGKGNGDVCQSYANEQCAPHP